ncbi:MAG TPA: hypothetical protein VNZ53_38730 [Steroidobacteraceae bacterium]|nr:hypothetical protein [Steroidobacteraceae bacterium]
MQNAIEKRCIIHRWFVVCQLLAAWRRSMSELGCPAGFTCPAAIANWPRFATSGYVSLDRSQSMVQQPDGPRRFIAAADSRRFAANGARSPGESAARHPCLAASGDRRRSTANSDRQTFAATGQQKRFSASGDRRRSTANGDRQTFAATARQTRFSSSGDRRRSTANSDRQTFAATGHQKRSSANGDRRRSTANSDRQGFGTISSRQELATACQ